LKRQRTDKTGNFDPELLMSRLIPPIKKDRGNL